MNHESVRACLGFDFGRWEKGVIGAGIAYAFQKTMGFKTSNDATGHQEWSKAYGTWIEPVVTIEWVLWVGFH